MCPQISTKSVIISWFYWCVPSRDCVSCYEITLIMRFACFILSRYFKNSEDWKIKSSWKSLNGEIQCPFSYLLIEIANESLRRHFFLMVSSYGMYYLKLIESARGSLCALYFSQFFPSFFFSWSTKMASENRAKDLRATINGTLLQNGKN